MIRIIGAIIAFILAIAGAVALVVYVQGADQRAAQGAKLQEVYVVSTLVPKGTPGAGISAYVTTEKLPAMAIQPDTVTDLNTLKAKVADADILVGEQLAQQRFVDPQTLAAQGDVPVPKGMQLVTIPLSVQSVVGGQVTAGDTVGFVYTSNTRSVVANDQTAQTQYVYHRMLVTRITAGTSYVPQSTPTAGTQSGSSSTSTQPATTIMVTLAATTPEVEKIVYAAQQQQNGNGGIWLTLEPKDATESGSTLRNGGNIFQ